MIKLIEEVGSRVSTHDEAYHGLFELLTLGILRLTGGAEKSSAGYLATESCIEDCDALGDCGGFNAKNMSPPSWIAICNPKTTFAVINISSAGSAECTLISYIITLHDTLRSISCVFIQTNVSLNTILTVKISLIELEITELVVVRIVSSSDIRSFDITAS